MMVRPSTVITDARFSGVSTGACIGHIGPEALAGGPIGRLLDDDVIRIEIDVRNNKGLVELVGHGTERFEASEAAAVLRKRPLRPAMGPHPGLPADTKLWAALQLASGGTWAGCVYDPERISDLIAGKLVKGSV